MLKRIKKVLFNPSKFFTETKQEIGIIEALKYLAVISLVYVGLLTFAYTVFFFAFGLLKHGMLISGFVVVSTFVMIYVFFLLLSFIGAGILHIFVKIFGGKGGYSMTYRVFVYSATPTYLFGWVSYVGVAAYLYSIYLWVKGASILHEISMGRAFLSILPVIVVVCLLAGFFFFFFGVIPLSSFMNTEELFQLAIGKVWE